MNIVGHEAHLFTSFFFQFLFYQYCLRPDFVLSVRPRINELTFRVYSRSLHPELLETHASRLIERENYQLKLEITTAGHVLDFWHDGCRLVEVSTSAHHDLPTHCNLFTRSIKSSFNEELILDDRIRHQTSVSLNLVDPKHLFSFNQIVGQSEPGNSLVHKFGSNGRIAMGALSFLNIESRARSVRVQAIHTFPDTCSLLTTESKFELI